MTPYIVNPPHILLMDLPVPLYQEPRRAPFEEGCAPLLHIYLLLAQQEQEGSNMA